MGTHRVEFIPQKNIIVECFRGQQPQIMTGHSGELEPWSFGSISPHLSFSFRYCHDSEPEWNRPKVIWSLSDMCGSGWERGQLTPHAAGEAGGGKVGAASIICGPVVSRSTVLVQSAPPPLASALIMTQLDRLKLLGCRRWLPIHLCIWNYTARPAT